MSPPEIVAIALAALALLAWAFILCAAHRFKRAEDRRARRLTMVPVATDDGAIVVRLDRDQIDALAAAIQRHKSAPRGHTFPNFVFTCNEPVESVSVRRPHCGAPVERAFTSLRPEQSRARKEAD